MADQTDIAPPASKKARVKAEKTCPCCGMPIGPHVLVQAMLGQLVADQRNLQTVGRLAAEGRITQSAKWEEALAANTTVIDKMTDLLVGDDPPAKCKAFARKAAKAWPKANEKLGRAKLQGQTKPVIEG